MPVPDITADPAAQERVQKAKLDANCALLEAGSAARAASVVNFLRARSKNLLAKAREAFAAGDNAKHGWYEAKATEAYIMADAIEDGADLRALEEIR